MALSTRHAAGFFKPQISPHFFVSLYGRVRGTNGKARELSSSTSSFGGERKIVKTLLGLVTGALVTCGSIIYFIDKSVRASGLEAKPPHYRWSMNGALSSLDHSSIRRGWHVYRNVCSTCHSLTYFHFRDLVEVSHTLEEVNAIAAEYEIEDGPDDDGNYYKRPCKIYDPLPSPFPNEEAARAANNGAHPVDLSFIINARHAGKDYIFSLLTGYNEPPAGFELAGGQLFNAYFPGGALSMPEMIQDGVVDYEDGTPATKSQVAKDVVEFLNWSANKEWDQRKVVCLKGVGICMILLAIMTQMHRQRWATVKTRKIIYVPKQKC